MFFDEFVYLLKEYGVPISFQHVVEFYEGLQKGIAPNLNKLFTFSRLSFVKKVEHFDAFERAFALYFYNIDIPPVSEGDEALFETKQFMKWLEREIEAGNLSKNYWELSENELMERFWDTLRRQMEEHHGGGRWIGAGGHSPFGHSGYKGGGIRVHGKSQNQSARMVIAERRFANYASSATLRAENIRQALESLKQMIPYGPRTSLNIDETIRETAKNGGEIELVLEKELRDKIRVILFLDSGGESMTPYLTLTRRLFSKIKDRFEDFKVYHFHNCIYGHVLPEGRYFDWNSLYKTEKILREEDLETRVLIIGDASMDPESELLNTSHYCTGRMGHDEEAGMVWLERIRDRFKYTVWLNPITKEMWETAYGSASINIIRNIFHMEDLTLNGIKSAVEYLNSR